MPAAEEARELRWRRTSYLGQSAEVCCPHGRGTGRRVVVRRWLEHGPGGPAGRVEVRLIQGDGRLPAFEQLYKEVLDGPNVYDLWRAIDRAAAGGRS